ncbi:unknown [Acholeplasma sp. CAG:878]|nr:unknown [Acholeplasma sp. CAG:878]
MPIFLFKSPLFYDIMLIGIGVPKKDLLKNRPFFLEKRNFLCI